MLSAVRLLPLLALAAPAQALVLTFDLPGSVNDDPLPADYADNVAANPQAGYTYGLAGGFTDQIVVTSADLFAYDAGFADLTNVLYVNTAVTEGSITFTANAGYGVQLDSFHLGGYDDAEADYVSLIIDDGLSTVYFATASVPVSSISALVVDSSTWGSTISGSVIRIRIVDENFVPGSIGIDNVRFQQVAVIPEPATAIGWLGLATFAHAALRRRRLG